MKVYLVRQPDGTLWMCTKKPSRNTYGRWSLNTPRASMIKLPPSMFPEVFDVDDEPTVCNMETEIKQTQAAMVKTTQEKIGIKPGQESCETKESTYRVLSGPYDPMAGLRKILGRQVGGKHYQHGKIQAIEYIMANNLNFAEGCVVKRVTRHRYKDGVQDILKAMQELSFIAAHEYGVIVNIETEKEKQAYLDGSPCGKEVIE